MGLNEQHARRLQDGITTRQTELRQSEAVVATAAYRLEKRALIGKVLIITGGAVVATRELASQLWGEGNTAAAVAYTLIGVTISAVGALEAAFRWEGRSSEMKALAAATRGTVRKADSLWQREVPSAKDDASSVIALQRVMDLQDEGLDTLHERAASLGMNITLELHGAGSEHDLGGPYLA
jgi:hypothetical protein